MSSENVYGIIYLATNKQNGKRYIGQTIQGMEKRKREHKNCQHKASHRYLSLYRAFIEFGFDNFDWEIICQANDKADLDDKEKYYIQCCKTMNPEFGYNMTYGGEGGAQPFTIRQKISFSLKGRIKSEEEKEKISKALKGKYAAEKHNWWKKTHSDETRNKMSIAQKGNKNHNYGKKASVETKEKMSLSRKGELHWNHKRVRCIETGNIFISSIEAMHKTGIDNSSIIKCCKWKRTTAGGFTWEYV